MAIGTKFRNQMVGFTIVISSILIFLPVLLSKDMIKREDPNAIAIDSNGAQVDSSGNLQLQAKPDLGTSLNLNQDNSLALNQNANFQANSNEELLTQSSISQENSAEMLDFANSKEPESNSAQESEEILTVAKPESKPVVQEKPKPQVKPAEPKEEILTVAKPKPAPKPEPKPEVSKPQPTNNGDKVIAGTRPQGDYVIQVGVFSKKANADNVVKKIQDAGIKVYAIEINSNGRQLYRVYAGSANSRNDLNSTLQKVDKLCGTKGKIVSF